MKHPMMILIAASITSATFVGWRVHSMRHQTPNHFEVVYDPSLSYTGGCQSVVGSAEEILHAPGVSAESTLTVLVLGNRSTAHEPRRLTTYGIPTSRKVIEGRRSGAARRDRLLRDLWGRCRSVRPTLITPIYLGVKQAIADLRAQGCKEGSRCELWVSSDLEENADRAIREEINYARKASDVPPRPLDNSGIAVTFCGYTQTAGHLLAPSSREIAKAVPRDPHRDDRLQAVWRSLFAVPSLVRFDPYCPQPTIMPAQEAVVQQEVRR